MVYSLIHLLNTLYTYILKMVAKPSDTLSLPQQEVEEEVYISEILRKINPFSYSNIFSSDRSTVEYITYGGDIYEFIDLVNSLNKAVVCDEFFNVDSIMERRGKAYLRNIFTTRKGEIIYPLEAITKLKEASIRLADGLELRNLNPKASLYLEANRLIAVYVLKDLYTFFKESDIDYDENRTLRGRTIYFGQPR